jgi:hypothetical protein
MKRATRSIVLSVVLGTLVAVLATVGIGLWFFQSHRNSEPASTQLAEAEFSQLRARFANEQPLLDMNRREPHAGHGMSQTATSLRLFHTVVFDTRGGRRLVHITVPYWFARRFADGGGEFRWLGQLTFLDDTEFDPEPIRLSLDQLERRGPGLVAYYQHASGGQFISWVE